jgi:hypothetical protein
MTGEEFGAKLDKISAQLAMLQQQYEKRRKVSFRIGAALFGGGALSMGMALIRVAGVPSAPTYGDIAQVAFGCVLLVGGGIMAALAYAARAPRTP